MAEKYTIKIQPNMSPEDAKKLEDELNKRFNRVSKKFSSNFTNALKSGVKTSLVAASGAIVAALVTNPIEKINEDVNKTLDKFDNSAQKAEQFGVDPAKYFRAERIAESFSVKDFQTIINRFSSSLEAARTKQDLTLANFTNDKDVIDSFNAFTQSLSSMKADDRNAALDRVFGGRMGLGVGDLAAQSSEEISSRNKRIFGNATDAQIAAELNKMATLKDLQDVNRQKLIVEELKRKSVAITAGTLRAQDAQERAKLSREVQQLSEYQIYAKQAMLQERMATSLDAMRADLVNFLLPALTMFVDFMPKVVEFFGKVIDLLERFVAKVKSLNPFR